MMNDTDTPEVDAEFGGKTATDQGYWNAVDLARRLERERNELRSELSEKISMGTICVASKDYIGGINNYCDNLKEINAELLESLRLVTNRASQQVCMHEETHRGGAIWEICDQCGCKWADDEGGKPEFKWPKQIESGWVTIEKAEKFLKQK